MRKWFSLVLAALLLAGTAVLSFGQGATAVIRGTVVDPSGAVVPQATVVARNVATGVESRAVTTASGIYNFPNLPPGTYDVRVEKSGFSRGLAKGVRINIGDLRDQNFKLGLAGAATEVTVTSEAPLIESTRTDVSTVVDEKDVRNLPVTSQMGFANTTSPSNDYLNLAATAPGVRFDYSGNLGTDIIAPGGWNNRDNSYNIDGGNITDQVDSGRDVLGASLDEVQEFQVLTNNYNAEYGQAGAAIVNVITKSGTNAFHGDGHAYFRGRNLSASNYFYNLGLAAQGIPIDGARRAPFQKQEWGFTAGGPFIKDKTFWFGSFEKTHQSTPTIITPPTGPVTVDSPFDEYMYSVKLDHSLTTNNKISARFYQVHQKLGNEVVQTGNNITPDSLVNAQVHDHTLNGSLTSTITPKMTNEARVFWHRLLSSTPTNTTAPGVSGPNFYSGADFCCPQGAKQDRYQGIDNLTWIHGSHTIKTGVSMTYFPFTELFPQYFYGVYDVNSAGVPQDFTFSFGPSRTFQATDSGRTVSKDNIYGAYLQDTWKIRPNITLNYGLRYDYEAGAFRGGALKIPGQPGCFQRNGIIPACSSDKNNFQPRIGFSWAPGFDNGKTLISGSFAEITMMAFLNVVLDSLNFDSVNLNTTTVTDPSVLAFFPNSPPQSVLAPVIPNPIGCTTPGCLGRVRPISDHLKNPELRHVNFSIRKELSPSTALEVDYVGVFGFGLFGESDTNYPAILADPASPGFFFLGSRPNPLFTAVRTNQNTRTSHYNGGIVSLQRRLASHVQFQANYTYSKTLTSSEDFFGTSEPADPRNIRAELAPAENDVRHVGNVSAVFDTTRLHGGSGLVSHLVNNWAMAWVGSFQSGRPYPISTGSAPSHTDRFFGIGNETQQRPNVEPNGVLNVLNIANFDGSLPTQIPGEFQFLSGNLSRNAGLGSPYSRLDFSLSRGFQLGSKESRRLEFKADAFNILNHTNFILYNSNPDVNVLPLGAPGCNVSCIDPISGHMFGSGGQLLTLSMLRHGKVSPNLLSPIFSGLGDPAGADIPRELQLSVRFRW